MSVAELVRQDAEIGFSVEDGIQQSVRIVRLEVPAGAAEEAGLHRGRNNFFSSSLDKIGTDRLKEYVADQGMEIYPRLERMHCVEPEQPGGNHEGVYAFEVRPAVRLPNLDGHEIKVPDPDTSGDFYDRLIAALPRKMPEWEKVDRPCQSGDRLTLLSVAPHPGKRKPFEYVLEEGKDAHLHELFVGASAGDGRSLKEAGNIQFKILKVERPIIPEFNLEFIQKIDPASKSREEFESSFRKVHASHMQGMISKVMLRRAEQLLDDAADEFPLPQIEVAFDLLNWRADMKRRGNRDFIGNVGEQGLAEVMARIQTKVRRRQLLQEFVRANSLIPTDAELDSYLDAMAAQYQEPELFKKRFKASDENLERARVNVSMGKFCDRVMDQARNVQEPMSFEQLEKIVLEGEAGEGSPFGSPKEG